MSTMLATRAVLEKIAALQRQGTAPQSRATLAPVATLAADRAAALNRGPADTNHLTLVRQDGIYILTQVKSWRGGEASFGVIPN